MNVSLEPLGAVALWAGLNLLVMLGLALNVSKHRFRADMPVGTGTDADLERAVRAHGNNTEYVPSVLVALGLLALTGTSTTAIHVLGGALLVGRLAHAHGIRILNSTGPPPTRVAGNLITWAVFGASAVMLVLNALSDTSAQ